MNIFGSIWLVFLAFEEVKAPISKASMSSVVIASLNNNVSNI